MTVLPAADPSSYRRYQWATLAALVAVLTGAVVGVLVPAGLGWDFANFYDTGRRAAAGQLAHLYDAYSPIDGEAPQGTMQFWGTPLSALFYVPLSFFAAPTASMLFKIQNSLACFVALGLLFTHVRRFTDRSAAGQWRFAALFVTLSLLYQPFWTVYRVGGQTTPTVFLLMVLALMTHLAGRDAWTALLLALVVAIKPAFVLMFGFLVVVSGPRFLLRAVLVSLVVAGAAIAALGWPIHQEFLGLLLRGTSISKSWFYNSSLYVPFENLRQLPEVQAAGPAVRLVLSAASIALKLAVVATLVMLVWRSRRLEWSDLARRHFGFITAVLFFVLVSQVLWEHYLSVLFIPLSYLWAARSRFGTEVERLLVGIAVAALGQNMIVVDFVRHRWVFDSVPAAFGIGVLKAAPLILTLLFLWRHGRQLLDSHATPAWASA